ncbi:UDP-N-acetylglucosamine--undecaprenyl-phosphate N-acetylglucosaminephosphotransferase [Pantoea sp. 1.19]|uniref:UDP-N-acetylglucosamine--undecaprenyl-phosphate N-acetylglucosaminephosphotransferase n=1 Tax=Pantoea sp. 1.19 TaxID=1925589 RepID=UPI000948A9E7|nr:UDP-N-acetylglucosamine--undecaprenyl-phosphate N-acetylglucosaminephosphotransferase [Pantoea sp. 1.19]
MQEIVCVFLGALALLFGARKVARRVGLVDKPNARKHHHGHIPLVGGVSVYLSLWILYALQPTWLPDFTLYMLCATLLLLVGVLDDRFDLPVLPRMGLQALVACLMMWSGLWLHSLGNVLFGYELALGAAGYLVTLLAVIAAINAFNMVDGIDGLLGALSCVTFGALGLVFNLAGNSEVALWCLCLMAACLPYILLNLGIPWGRKFKVFMGDAGSTLIGFTVIWLLILATQGHDAAMRPVTALWLIAVPLMDMLRVMVTRIRRGDSPFKPDREHLHHLLQRAGFSGRGTLALMFAFAVLFAAFGILLDLGHVGDFWQLVLFAGSFLLLNTVTRAAAKLKLTFEKLLAFK